MYSVAKYWMGRQATNLSIQTDFKNLNLYIKPNVSFQARTYKLTNQLVYQNLNQIWSNIHDLQCHPVVSFTNLQKSSSLSLLPHWFASLTLCWCVANNTNLSVHGSDLLNRAIVWRDQWGYHFLSNSWPKWPFCLWKRSGFFTARQSIHSPQ